MTNEAIQTAVKDLKKKIFEFCNLNTMTDEQLEEKIEEFSEEYLSGQYVTIEEKLDICEQVFSSIRGLGLLDSIIKDDNITEVMINGPSHIFIEKNGRLIHLDQTFEDERQ